MIQHHTKNKGDLGVLKAKLDLLTKGYMTLTPDTEHAPFDVVAFKEGKFLRVQVKYREITNGFIAVPFSTCWADKHGTHSKKVDRSLIDLYCVYCPSTDRCYYLDPSKYSNAISLRVFPPKNNQTSGIHLAENFLNIPDYL